MPGEAGIEGKVVLNATISKQGDMEKLKAISGPKELQQSSLDAVRQWKYKPFLLNGDPVAVKTTVNVTYTLSKMTEARREAGNRYLVSALRPWPSFPWSLPLYSWLVPLSLSVVLITLNEAANLPRTLDSVAWAQEIIVVDSGSTDATLEIAREGRRSRL